MTLALRKSTDRGFADHGWLKAKHTFSFAGYLDPRFMGYRTLRVINEDRIAGEQGFGVHPHRDMEIITYVLAGALRHTDSMGHSSILEPGDVQVMSAGTGVRHSEVNASSEELRLLQIWIEPSERGGNPSYKEKYFSDKDKRDQWLQLVGPRESSCDLTIKQDAKLFVTKLSPGNSLGYATAMKRGHWLHVVEGQIVVDGQTLAGGDAVAIENVDLIEVTAEQESEVLLFDLA